MVTWNPNTPGTIGLEWDVATEGVTALSTSTSCVAIYVPSTATETIDKLYLPHTWTGAATGYGKLAVDIYDAADTGAGASPTVVKYAPNVTQANNNMFTAYPWSSITTTVHTYINEEPYVDSSYVAFANTSTCRLEFGSQGHTGQVQSVTFYVRAMGYAGGTPVVSVQLYYNGAYVSTLGTLAPPADSDDVGSRFPHFQTYTFGPFTTNPRTGVAWTAADVVSFDTAGTGHALGFSLTSGLVGVSYVSMSVAAGTDKRKATGSTATQTSLPSGSQTNLPVTLAADWAKVSGTNYLLIARRIEDPTGAASTLIPQPVYLGTAASPWTGKSYTSTIDSSGFIATLGAVDTTKTYPFWLGIKTTNVMSVDSEPYWDLIAEPCHTSSTLKQGVLGTVATYKGVRAMVAYSTSAVPTTNLTVKIKRTSDNVQLGGDGTITTAIVTAATVVGTVGGYNFVLVDIDLASSATLAAVAYYFEFTAATASTVPWYVLQVDGTASHALTGNQTFGGATYQSTVNGVAQAQGDLIVRTSTSPTAPSSITVTNTTTTINGTSIDYAAISWVNGGALGASFLRWEIERSEDAAVTWVQIATIATEATVTFSDYESKRNNANQYRVRIVRNDLARSDYRTETGTVTPASVVGSKAIFTTNSNSALTVGYVPHGTSAAYEFLSADETVFLRLHARDYQAAFKPTEQRGARWPFTVQVHTLQAAPSAGAGIQAFTVLRAVADNATAPYLCLHTGDGERFFGALQVGRGNRDLGTGAYFADCVFTQTQLAPSTVAL